MRHAQEEERKQFNALQRYLKNLRPNKPECDAFLLRCIYGSDFSNQGEGISLSLFSSNIRTTSIFRVLFLYRQCLALAALERVHTSLAEV